VPYCTVLTDLADYPPRFWMERAPGSTVVCGSAAAVEQALRVPYPPQDVHRVSGMILRPGFYRPQLLDRDTWRRAMGLPTDQPVGIVMFGGHGSADMKTIARQLPQVPLILLCGHNQDLMQALQQMPAAAPRVVLDHTPQVAELMRMADFFIGKPGPGSLSEAVHCGLPVITCLNTATLPQERFNAEWIRSQGYGLVVRRYSEIAQAVADLLGRREEFKTAVSAQENRAVYEVLDIFELLLRRAADPLESQPVRRLPAQVGSWLLEPAT
jgi:UDP-N-acetylglucosamine:LPS N-acetylglucosamine transferase